MAVTDWRAWTAQSGGTLPTGTFPVAFPGIGAITDLINGATSIPTYPNTPTTVNAVDPFAGWTSQKEASASHTMRPVVPGLTSP